MKELTSSTKVVADAFDLNYINPAKFV